MNSRFKKSKRVNRKKSFWTNIDTTVCIKVFLLLFVVLIFIFLSSHVFSTSYCEFKYGNEMEEFYQKNLHSDFLIDTITLYHSASATQNTTIKNTFLLDIYQFTDISFYINNSKNIIVKSFNIDNISYNFNSQTSNVALVYKNPLDFGKLTSFNINLLEKIDFEVLSSNNNTDFSTPYVYNNLSNPITLEFIHSKVVGNFNANNISIEYNGKLLKNANVNLDNISGSIYFDINIVDITDNFYSYRIRVPINLKSNNFAIHSGELLENLDVKKENLFLKNNS